jgi:hypothetical protein
MGRDSEARQGYAARQYSQSLCSALRSAVDHAHHRPTLPRSSPRSRSFVQPGAPPRPRLRATAIRRLRWAGIPRHKQPLTPATALDIFIRCILLGDMPRSLHHIFHHSRVDGRPVGHDLDRQRPDPQRAGEEPSCCSGGPAGRDQHVDHLTTLIHRPVQVGPAASDLDVGVGSTNQRSPAAWRHGRAASMNSGVNVCTHR